MNKSTGISEDPGPLEPAWEDDLHALYAELDREIAAISPVCELSGRCCRFLEYGHTLFVSTAEVGYLLGLAGPPARPLDEGASCPWQDSRGHCTARDARPLGCRVYYCDPAFQDEGAPAFRAIHRSHEEVVERIWDFMELRTAASAPRRGATAGAIPSESFLTLL